MRVYTVRKPGGTKDREFAAYASLLEESGIDLSRVPRTQEPGAGIVLHRVCWCACPGPVVQAGSLPACFSSVAQAGSLCYGSKPGAESFLTG